MREKFLVLPSEIPFDGMRDHDLEECVYWLLDDMGAKDLIWRIGGKGKGAADGGRDLEATFNIPSPDGEITQQRWWVDAKGRAGTVEKAAVQDAVLNAQGRDDIDVLVIVTNTTFSNPTREWVTETMRNRPRPKVRLWDRSDLERLLPKHPTAALRLFSKALSPQGRLEAVTKRFWDFGGYADAASLGAIWRARDELSWSEQAHIAIVVSEVAVGDPTKRPWSATLPEPVLAAVFVNSLAHTLYFVRKTEDAGNDQYPLIRAMAHILVACSLRLEPTVVSNLIHVAFSDEDGIAYPAEAVDILLSPVFTRAYAELRDVCSGKCSKVHLSDSDKELSEKEQKTYWHRYRYDKSRDTEEEPRLLILQSTTGVCEVGFEMEAIGGCPLLEANLNDASNYAELVEDLAIITKFRYAESVEG